MKKLRLLFTTDCPRHCEGCCNKQWDLLKLPIFHIEDTRKYNQILITGGEPMLYPNAVCDFCEVLKWKSPNIKIYIYTAWTKHWVRRHLDLFKIVDGFTITLHDQKAADEFSEIEGSLRLNSCNYKNKSMRLNIFKGITYPPVWDLYSIKDNIVWLENCPLPTDEVFMNYSTYKS